MLGNIWHSEVPRMAFSSKQYSDFFLTQMSSKALGWFGTRSRDGVPQTRPRKVGFDNCYCDKFNQNGN